MIHLTPKRIVTGISGGCLALILLICSILFVSQAAHVFSPLSSIGVMNLLAIVFLAGFGITIYAYPEHPEEKRQQQQSAIQERKRRAMKAARPKMEEKKADEAIFSALNTLFPDQSNLISQYRADLVQTEILTEGTDEIFVLKSNHPVILMDRLPIPLPHYCVSRVSLGILTFTDQASHKEAPTDYIRQRATLTLKLARLTSIYTLEFYAPIFQFSTSSQNALCHFLSIFPKYPRDDWRGPVMLRAATTMGNVSLSSPLSLDLDAQTTSFEPITTWVANANHQKNHSLLMDDQIHWPKPFPLFVYLQYQGSETTSKHPTALGHALFDLRDLIDLNETRIQSGAVDRWVDYDLSVDIGTSTTCVAFCRKDGHPTNVSVGHEFVLGEGVKASPKGPPSGWKLLAGNPDRAGAYGCGEHLWVQAGYLPTALVFPSQSQADTLIKEPAPGSQAQAWLPQYFENHHESTFSIYRFKSPDLITYTPEDVSRSESAFRLLSTYTWHLGHAIAAVHAFPLSDQTGSYYPTLRNARVALTYPNLEWPSSDPEKKCLYADIFFKIGHTFSFALQSVWRDVKTHEPILETVAAHEAARKKNRKRSRPAGDHSFAPITVLADFGGLTFQVTIQVNPITKRNVKPLHSGFSMTYELGGEFFLDALSYLHHHQNRKAWRDGYQVLRKMIDEDQCFSDGHDFGMLTDAQRLTEAILKRNVELIKRQLEAARIAADPCLYPYGSRFGPAEIYFVGQGWRLSRMQIPNQERFSSMVDFLTQKFEEEFSQNVLPTVISKEEVCQAALEWMDQERPKDQEKNRSLRAWISKGFVHVKGARYGHKDNRPKQEPMMEETPKRYRMAKIPLNECFGVDVAISNPNHVFRYWSEVYKQDVAKMIPDPDDLWWETFTENAILKPIPLWSFDPDKTIPDKLVSHDSVTYLASRSPLTQWIAYSGAARLVLDFFKSLSSP